MLGSLVVIRRVIKSQVLQQTATGVFSFFEKKIRKSNVFFVFSGSSAVGCSLCSCRTEADRLNYVLLYMFKNDGTTVHRS